MPTLYDIAAEHQDLMLAITDADGEMSEEQLKQLAKIEYDFDGKIEACCKFHQNLKATEEALKTEAARLTERKRIVGNEASRMKKYILMAMNMAERTEAGDVLKAKIAKGVESVEISDPVKIPKGFIKMEPKILKAEIAKAIKAGEKVPGATMVRGEDSVRIK